MASDKMMKLFAKKKASGDMMDDNEKNAKLSVLQHLHDMAKSAMGDKLHGLGKVEVASDSPEGLESGLEHAHDLLKGVDEKHFNDDTNEDHGHGDMMPEEDDEREEGDEASQAGGLGMETAPEGDGEDEDEDLPEHEIDAKLEKLMALKKRKGMA